MAKFYTELDENLRKFIASQHIFFHASAPSQGRINLSPKGLDTFRVLSDQRVAYLDLTGSECGTTPLIPSARRRRIQSGGVFPTNPGRTTVSARRSSSWPRFMHPPPPHGRSASHAEDARTTCCSAPPEEALPKAWAQI